MNHDTTPHVPDTGDKSGSLHEVPSHPAPITDWGKADNSQAHVTGVPTH